MAFLSDIEIAQGAKLRPITEIAKAAGIAYLSDYLHAARFLTRAAGKGCTLLM